MKKFLLKVLLFFACVVVMDLAFGHFFSFLRTHANGGSTANCEYIANRATDDIIILGSSRATHHYVPQIIEDSLGMSCYNCGEEGNGIVLAYGRFKMLTSRYKPKLVIYEITPEFDYYNTEPNTKYLGYLRPYYSNDGIKGIFDDFDDDLSFLKMKSKMYQNTAKILPNMVDNVIYRDNMKGYSPLYGKINVDNTTGTSKKNGKKLEIDSLKMQYVERIIVDAQSMSVPIVFVISPKFGEVSNLANYEPVLALCRKYGVHYYNFTNRVPFTLNADYFQDNGHMNNQGAVAYTQLLVKEVLNNKH